MIRLIAYVSGAMCILIAGLLELSIAAVVLGALVAAAVPVTAWLLAVSSVGDS